MGQISGGGGGGAVPPGLVQTLFYKLHWNPHATGVADVPMTSVIAGGPANPWLAVRTYFVNNTAGVTPAGLQIMEVWSGPGHTGVAITFNISSLNAFPVIAPFSTVTDDPLAYDIAIGSGPARQCIPAGPNAFLSMSAAVPAPDLDIDVYVVGYVLPFGP